MLKEGIDESLLVIEQKIQEEIKAIDDKLAKQFEQLVKEELKSNK